MRDFSTADLPADQCERVFSQPECDIDSEFLGFLKIYEALAQVIPKHFTVVDLGCAYNPQCFLFSDHHKFIAVDLPGEAPKERFTSDNCEIVEMKISDFIRERAPQLPMPTTFAICSYVPDWYDENRRLVRETFSNVFTFYPAGETKPLIRRDTKRRH